MFRRMGWRHLLLVSLIFGLLACSRPSLYQAQIYVFGTLVDVSLWGVEAEQAEQAIASVNQALRVMHHEWHAWQPGPLVDLNRAFAEGRAMEPAPSLLPLIEQSKTLYRQSEGLFNPAIGQLLALWGFQRDVPPDGPIPDAEAIRRLVEAAPGMDAVSIDGQEVASSNRHVQLDFGAFAKGYAVDRLIDILREHGIHNAIINAGGDLRAIGSKGDKPWRVGVKHPQGGGILASIEVQGDESVYTSGNYERFRAHEGIHYAHILDPRTGMPVEGIASVTVIHDNGAVADAAATALVVAGVENWQRIARNMGIQYVMLVDEQGTVYLNPAMRQRLQFVGDEPPMVLSEPLSKD